MGTNRERLGPLEVLQRIIRHLAQQETTKHCPKCNARVRAIRPGTSRLWHLSWTVVTLGLWSIVWIVDVVRRPGWRCERCDTRL